MSRIWVKICGITSLDDALCALDAGADAIGLNLVASSPRRVDPATAAAICAAVRDRLTPVAVVADPSLDEARELRAATGIQALQLHGRETPEQLAALLPDAFKAIRVGGASDVELAAAYGGDRLLVDAKVPGTLGGSGRTFDWTLVTALARRRSLILAGGLTPGNVAEAVSVVQPWGVDTASGVEQPGDPRRKDPARVVEFVRAARSVAS